MVESESPSMGQFDFQLSIPGRGRRSRGRAADCGNPHLTFSKDSHHQPLHYEAQGILTRHEW